MPPSPAETPENETNPQTQDQLSLNPWEAAYLRFESPEEEIRKFIRRLTRLGAPQWPRDSEIVELFCGRGNGLIALQRLGFTRLEGVDLSPRLLAKFTFGIARSPFPAETERACWRYSTLKSASGPLPFADRSKDVLIVQGGLHHLPALPDDLDQTFSEMQRVLRTNGRVMFVEPWRTPFLTFVHFISEISMVRRISSKLDAFATMTEYEIRTYEQWLGQPELIKKIARTHFLPVHESFAWGKWNFVGTPR